MAPKRPAAPLSELRDEKKLRKNALPLEPVMLDDLPSDTMAAVLLLRSCFPLVKDGPIRPVALRSQLNLIVKDATVVERELEELRKVRNGHVLPRCAAHYVVASLTAPHDQASLVRVFKLASGVGDYGVMLDQDYRVGERRLFCSRGGRAA